MRQFNVTGMSCAACVARVEKAVSKLDGVESCAVSLLTNSMGVDGTASDADIIAAVASAGYGASVKGAVTAQADPVSDDPLADRETPVLRRRLVSSLVFLAVLMYISMGHSMWGWPVPSFFDGNHVAVAVVQLLLAGIVMVINQKFFISGIAGLMHRAPNMDTLVALGSGASFGWSVYALLAMTASHDASHWMHELYFESAATILTLITVGKMLEARSKGRTTDALRSLMKLAPQTAVVVRDGAETVVPIESVRIGDIFVVRPGENVPVDGVVVDGSSAVDESALTGESIPVDKGAGDSVSAATTNRSGFIRCEATRVGEDTTLSRIIKMVSDAAATKAPIAKLADRVSGIFVPAVIGIALLTAAAWLAAGESAGFALARAISVLVISCPCALGLATPVAIMVGSGVGARRGILFKTAASLEAAGRVEAVALDKTGTITTGEPRVTDVLPTNGHDARDLLSLAASLEARSEHPLARAVMHHASAMGISPLAVDGFRALPGSGVEASLDGVPLLAGSLKAVEAHAHISDDVRSAAARLAEQGRTPLFFARGGELVGTIAVADAIKHDSPDAVRELRRMGVRVVMLTGDNERTARAIGAEAGVDDVIAGVLPEGKEIAVRELSSRGGVAMVGDGINDAPALTRADVGIAIGAGADVAIDAADVVLVKSRLADVPAAIALSRATLRNIRENLFWAFAYNVCGIPLAAGLFIPLFGWRLEPMFGAAAMSLSSFCVVTNALRLNFVKLYDAKEETKHESEVNSMEKTFKVEGMMCSNCERHVKTALEAIDGVTEATASHTSGSVVVKMSKQVPDDKLIAAITDQGYEVK